MNLNQITQQTTHCRLVQPSERLDVLLQSVIQSLNHVSNQKSQILLPDIGESDRLIQEPGKFAELIETLITNICNAADIGSIIKLTVFFCENSLVILFDYNCTKSMLTLNPQTARNLHGAYGGTQGSGNPSELNLSYIKELAELQSCNVWMINASGKKGVRVYLSFPN